MTTRRSFREMVSRLEEKHSATLMDRARAANRLAKELRGRSRRNAYSVKHRALTGLVRKFPERTYVREDFRQPAFLVVGLSASNSGLHVPASLVPERRS